MIRIGLAAVAASLATAAPGQSTDTPDLLPGESVLRVEAEGFVMRIPDQLVVSIGIHSQGQTPKEVADANRAKLSALMRDLNAFGVSEGEIGADELAATPIYAETNGEEDRSRILGYAARQRLSIKIKDLSRFQPIIQRLSEEGFGELQAAFMIIDRSAATAEAQRNAISNARAEADNMAGALGKRVGRALLVGNSDSAYRGWQTHGQSIVVTGSRVQPLVLKPAPVRIESKVYVDWALVDR